MTSLFARILVWFLATAAITAIGFLVTISLTMGASEEHLPPFLRSVPFLLGEAREAYETGGRPALERLVDHVHRAFGAEAVFTDAEGRDLVTGRDRSELKEHVRRRGFLRARPRSLTYGRASDDGRYWFFLVIPRERAGFRAFLPQHLWVITAVLVLCYWLALHLTAPLRQLEKTVERFGQGDFSARAGSTRRDEIGRLAAAFDQMAGRIQKLLAAQQRLLLDISHELRSPLARLGVAVELARTGPDRAAALDRIAKESERLNALVGELLQVTRAEADPTTLRRDPLRLDELVKDVVESSAIEAQARGCALQFNASPPVEFRGDAELLRRAVENVVRNAIRHAPGGTAVEVSLEATGARAVVRVRDHGPGVPEEALERIFDAFYRLEDDRNRSSGGAGLGLAIARRAVILHQGRIQARNAKPGLVVDIELPLGAR